MPMKLDRKRVWIMYSGVRWCFFCIVDVVVIVVAGEEEEVEVLLLFLLLCFAATQRSRRG